MRLNLEWKKTFVARLRKKLKTHTKRSPRKIRVNGYKTKGYSRYVCIIRESFYVYNLMIEDSNEAGINFDKWIDATKVKKIKIFKENFSVPNFDKFGIKYKVRVY